MKGVGLWFMVSVEQDLHRIQRSDAMDSFVQRHASSVIGKLSGFDRLLFRGTLRRLASAKGLFSYLWMLKVLLKDFGDWSANLTKQVRDSAEQVARQAGRPILYVSDSSLRKEELARQIARRDGIDRGLVCMLTAVEPCCSYDINRNRATKKLELVPRHRKCLHLYHYSIDPVLGFMHARLQTWLPFNLKVCINGREWLSRQMDRAGISYVRQENCFTRVSDPAAAQALLDEQLKSDWPKLLEKVHAAVHPGYEQLFGPSSSVAVERYWSVDQSEWATDVMFKDAPSLAGLYPRLIGQGIRTLGSRDVMRFLGHRVPATHGGVNGHFAGEVVSDVKQRAEGLRIKHRVNSNSVKMYDKHGSVLRVETTINDAGQFKVYRGTQAEPDKLAWRQMRKGVADLHRRAQVSQASNQRYMETMAAVEQTSSVGESLSPVCRAITCQGRRVRALRPFDAGDMQLLEAVSRGEFAIKGFRNRDIRQLLCGPDESKDITTLRRHSGQITRKLRLLRAHGLIKKVPRTHRYLLSDKGTNLITVLLATRDADAKRLIAAAA
jgi:hypothetical protein